MDSGQANSNQPSGAADTPSAPAQSDYLPNQPITSGNIPAPDAPATASTGQPHPFISHHPTQTFSNDSGDIVLQSGGEGKKTNAPILIIVIVIVLLVVGGIILLLSTLLKSGTFSKVDVLEDFTAFYDYLKDGPENPEAYLDTSEKPENEWFFQALLKSTADPEQRAEYANTITEKYQNFRQTLTTALSKNKITINDALQRSLANYDSIVNMLVTYYDYNGMTQKVLTAYADGDHESAEKVVRQITYADSTSSSMASSYYDVLYRYYSMQLELYNYYRQYGCLASQKIDTECVSAHENDERIVALITRSSTLYQALDSVLLSLVPSIESETTDVLDNLRSIANE